MFCILHLVISGTLLLYNMLLDSGIYSSFMCGPKLHFWDKSQSAPKLHFWDKSQSAIQFFGQILCRLEHILYMLFEQFFHRKGLVVWFM